MHWSVRIGLLLLAVPLLAAVAGPPTATGDDAGWAAYGGDAGGQRYSTAKQIDRTNVAGLHPIWTYHTHAMDSHRAGSLSASFETTPVLFKGLLIFTTPFGKIVALDPATGLEQWNHPPPLEELAEGEVITSRGVATWDGGGTVPCSSRVFSVTPNGLLLAVDAPHGGPCAEFGDYGVDLKAGLSERDKGFRVTSAPTVVGDVVVVGSSITDSGAVETAKGTVRAYDVRTGRQRWAWEPIPWAAANTPHTGGANAWSTFSADPQLGLIYVPTGSASPRYYGGMRPGDGRDANSIVALDAATGRKVWAFQLVHHDLWDYDVPSQPLLFTWHGNVPAIAVTTKMGMVFVLDRRTGVPLFPVEERPVPKSDVPGEVASVTQPFSTPPSLSPLTLPVTGPNLERDAADAEYCRQQIAGLRYDGIYTPPSLKGSLVFPGSFGAVNWGSAAYDPQSGVLYANTNRLPYMVQLLRPNQGTPPIVLFERGFGSPLKLRLSLLTVIVGLIAALRRRGWGWMVLLVGLAGLFYGIWQKHLEIVQKELESTPEYVMRHMFGQDHSLQPGAPYELYRHPLVDHRGLPCTAELWGTVAALNLQTGTMVWEQPHGTEVPGKQTGALSLGGVIVTAGGLVFSAGTREPLLRAYDAATGEELWKGHLPVPAQATPMTYEIGGRQFVVIAAGGNGLWGTATGDSLVAFALN